MSFERERLALRGRLVEAELKRKDLDSRVSALKHTIRAELDTYKDVLDTNVLEAADMMKLLLTAHREYAEVTALIERLKKDLGE